MAEVHGSVVIDGVVLVDPVVHGDERGLFVETWRQEWLPDVPEMVQANRADRTAGTVVGLHYHRHQADYWYVVAGRARVVLHDLRVGSPTLGATLELDLGGAGPERHRGVYIPPGVAHGFAAVTDVTLTYLVDGLAGLAPLCVWFGMGAATCERKLSAHAPRAGRALFYGWLASFVAATFLPYT